MIIDHLLEFADATALDTTGTGLKQVGVATDLGLARDISRGQPLYLVIEVDTAVTSAGSATVEFWLVSDASATLAVDGSATVHSKSPAVPKATLVAGYTMVIPLGSGGNAFERYLGILQNVGTAALTAGKVNAFLTMDPPGWGAFAQGTV